MNGKPNMYVYYNSACPVCKAGIEGQMKKASACEIQWNDVHTDNALVSQVGSELELVRERLHVVDENGRLQVGFVALLAINPALFAKSLGVFGFQFGLPVGNSSLQSGIAHHTGQVSDMVSFAPANQQLPTLVLSLILMVADLGANGVEDTRFIEKLEHAWVY